MRYLRWYALSLHRLQHGLDGQSAEVGGRPARHDRGVYGLGMGVVGNACVVDIDRHALQRQGSAASGLTDAYHQGRAVQLQQARQLQQGRSKHGRQLRSHHHVPGHAPAVQGLNSQPARVDAFAAKSVKACEQNPGKVGRC